MNITIPATRQGCDFTLDEDGHQEKWLPSVQMVGDRVKCEIKNLPSLHLTSCSAGFWQLWREAEVGQILVSRLFSLSHTHLPQNCTRLQKDSDPANPSKTGWVTHQTQPDSRGSPILIEQKMLPLSPSQEDQVWNDTSELLCFNPLLTHCDPIQKCQ